MTDHKPLDELPEALQHALRGLGDVRAPEELRHRVDLARLPEVQAPAELWSRVAPEVAKVAREGTSRVQGGGGRLLQFPMRRLATAAAAVLVAGIGITLMLQQDVPERPTLSAGAPDAVRAEYRARFVAEEVSEDEMSSTGRAFVGMLGGELES